MTEPYTLKIHMPHGDPEGIRIIGQMSWAGEAITFPRGHWDLIKDRPSLDTAGIYILTSDTHDKNNLQPLYIGEGDGVRDRIEDHCRDKAFWDWGIAFVSTNNSLNKSHVKWMEYMLIQQAIRIQRYALDNNVTPREPVFNESDKADTERFLKEILRILPIVGIKAFEKPKSLPIDNKQSQNHFIRPQQYTPVSTFSSAEKESVNPTLAPTQRSALPDPATIIAEQEDYDMVVVPAQPETFKKLFLNERCWYPTRLSDRAVPKIKFLAIYRVAPISAITHWVEIESIERYGENNRYLLKFRDNIQELESPIRYHGKKGQGGGGQLQAPRYTTKERLLSAHSLSDIWATS